MKKITRISLSMVAALSLSIYSSPDATCGLREGEWKELEDINSARESGLFSEKNKKNQRQVIIGSQGTVYISSKTSICPTMKLLSFPGDLVRKQIFYNGRDTLAVVFEGDVTRVWVRPTK